MKKYNLVVFGSTFFSAGLSASYKGSILVIEPKTKPGYEFIDSFHTGNIREYSPITCEGKAFFEYLHKCNLTDNSYILNWTSYLAKVITQTSADYLLMTDILNVRNEEGGYVITVFNSMGKSEIFAEKIIDTRVHLYEKKTINFLVKGNVICKAGENVGIIAVYNDLYLAEVKLDRDDDYPQARKKAMEGFIYLKTLSEDISLVAIADEMYKKSSIEKKELYSGYIQCPSSFYDNGIEAYDMGAKTGGEIL